MSYQYDVYDLEPAQPLYNEPVQTQYLRGEQVIHHNEVFICPPIEYVVLVICMGVFVFCVDLLLLIMKYCEPHRVTRVPGQVIKI
mgnify:CR=1 FL=1